MPLQVIVIGAGVGGLCAAVALHKAGHSVKVFEKSNFTNEAGSAVLITPNGARVLTSLGFDFARARADEMTYFEVMDGISLRPLSPHHLRDPREEFGSPLYTIHRADLLGELRRLASGLDVQLGARVAAVDEREGWVGLGDGSRRRADLIVAGDGVHSTARGAVLRGVPASSAEAVPSGLSAFRFMIPTASLREDAHFQRLQEMRGLQSCLFADTTRDGQHHLVWFTCRNREVQVFVGIHDSLQNSEEDLKTVMLNEFGHFNESLTHVIKVAPFVVDWPLSVLEPLPIWHKEKVVLIGDAAHPMLPLGAQGANQAIEDAGALGAIFRHCSRPEDIPRSLALFDKVRRLRASRIQTLSQVRLGREKDVEAQVRRYADPPGSDIPTTFSERYQHEYGYDVFAACEELMS